MSERDAGYYKARLDAALRFRAYGGREDRWRRYIKRLGHVFYTSVQPEEAPTINILASRIRSLVPQLAIGVPGVKVTPDDPDADLNIAAALGVKLEKEWRGNGMEAQLWRSVLDCITFGIGIGFVGYEARIEEPPGKTKKKGVAKALSAIGIGPKDAEEPPARAMSGRLFFERVSPLNFVMDPSADHWTNARYMARRLFITQAQADAIAPGAFKASSYANVGERQGGSETDPYTRDDPQLANVFTDAALRVEVWELWDLDERKTVYLDASGVVPSPKCIQDWKSPAEWFPFAIATWDDIPDCVWPEGLAAALEPLNNELHVIRKRELQALRTGIRKYKAIGQLTSKARQAVVSDRDGEVVELDVESDIQPLSWNPIPPDMYLVENRVKQDIDEVSNTSHMLAQGTSPVRKTATETAFIQAASDAMMSYRQVTVERFAKRILSLMLEVMTELDDAPTSVRINNAMPGVLDDEGNEVPIGGEVVVTFVPSEHKGRYKVEVEQGSMVAQAKDLERQQLLAIRDRLKDEPYFDKRAFDLMLLSTLPSIKDASKFITQAPPQPTPMPQQAPELPGMVPGGGAPAMMEGGEMPAQAEEADVLAALMGSMAPETM